MGPFRCARCSKCGSDLAEGPSSHREPLAHSLIKQDIEVDTDAGKVKAGDLSRCAFCQKTKAEIEQLRQPFVYWDDPAEAERRERERAEFEVVMKNLHAKSEGK